MLGGLASVFVVVMLERDIIVVAVTVSSGLNGSR